MNETEIAYAIGLEPLAAVEYLKSKGIQIPAIWKEVLEKSRLAAKYATDKLKLDLTQKAVDEMKALKAKADDVAAKVDEVLNESEKIIKRAVTEGIDETVFIKEMQKTLADKGFYQPKGRLSLIFRTQVSQAYSAGRWQIIEEAKSLMPYLKYRSAMLPTSRDPHKRLNNLVFRADDPIWRKIYPPNGFHCMCWVEQLSEGDLRRMGLKVSESGDMPWLTTVPDKGWARNPGMDIFKPDLTPYDPSIRKKYEEAA